MSTLSSLQGNSDYRTINLIIIYILTADTIHPLWQEVKSVDGKLIYFNPYTGRYNSDYLFNTIWQRSVIIKLLSHETVCKSFCWSVD